MIKHRIGILGGTFDPVHIGHLILAQSAYEILNLEKVYFMISANPPHKRLRYGGAANEQRLEMTRLAIEDDPRFELELIEYESEGYSYTYKTIQKLKELHPENEYFFIAGGDSLIAFPQWKNPHLISKMCRLVIGERQGFSDEDIHNIIKLRNEEFNNAFILIDTPVIDVSSREIRERISRGLSSKYYLPETVNDYIIENDLYKNIQNEVL